MQTAWANFAKDPIAGPGWASYKDGKTRGVNMVGLAALGAGDGSGSRVTMIPEYAVDYRCPLYSELLESPLI